MNQHPLTRDVLIRVFFFGAFAVILYQLFLLAEPFLTAMLVAAMLAMMVFPLHQRLLRRLPNPTWASLVSTLSVLLLAVLPLLGLAWFFIRETAELVPVAQRFLEDLRDHDWPALEAHLPVMFQNGLHSLFALLERLNIDLRQVFLDNAQMIGTHVTLWASAALRNTLVLLMNAVILSVVLFFAFRDGESLLRWVLSLIPMQAHHKKVVAQRINETFRAVVIGSFLTASTQGAVALIGFLIAGVRLPVVLGIATSIASMLGGSFLVTLPVAFSVMHESPAWGVFLLIWAILVVGLMDNLLKPIFIGSRAHMPFILIFFSIVGGIRLYGLLGFILGPVLVASFLSFVKIYREEYN
jgi:predicted PurR-regulated permease PerM